MKNGFNSRSYAPSLAVPTPWSALAFHPVDGYAQSLPYHISTFILPMHKYLFLVLFVIVQVWTILIHDGDMISGHLLERYINSPAHHTLHHLYFTCNYGQVRKSPLELADNSTLHGPTRTLVRTARHSPNSILCMRP